MKTLMKAVFVADRGMGFKNAYGKLKVPLKIDVSATASQPAVE